MKKKVRTPEQWRQLIDEQAKSPEKGNWPLLRRRMFNSLAFAALDRSGMVCVLAMLDKLYLERTDKRKGVKSTVTRYQNNGEFTITTNELIARGLKSKEAIARGKRRAWELGFFDVLEPGDLFRAGRFRVSDRCEKYPDGDYLPHGQPPPGTNLGYGFLPGDRDHEKSKSRSEIEPRQHVRKSNVSVKQTLRMEIGRSLSDDLVEKTAREAELLKSESPPSEGPKTERNNYLPVPKQPLGSPKNEEEVSTTLPEKLKGTAQKKKTGGTKQEPRGRSENFLDWPFQKKIVDALKIYGHGDVLSSSFGSADRTVKYEFKSGLKLVISPHDFSINDSQISNYDFDRVLNRDGRESNDPDERLSDLLLELRKTIWRCQKCERLDDTGYSFICRYPPDGKDLRLVDTACRKVQAADGNSGEESQ